MHLMPSIREGRKSSELETLVLSDEHLDYLGQIAREMNPDMPESFGLPHLIRTIIDRVEQSGIDLTDACSEEDIARLAANTLRDPRDRRRDPRTSARLFSSTATRSAARRSHRSSLPVTGRFRSGTTPRSGRG
jgi:hypothetical protein